MECGGLLPRNREGKPSHSKTNMAGMMINAKFLPASPIGILNSVFITN